MPVEWIDVSSLSFNTLLLLETAQLSWLPGWVPEDAFAIAIKANPVVEWFIRHKCPSISNWLDEILAQVDGPQNRETVYQAEREILQTINDLVVYALDPSIYDAQPFLGWDSNELTSVADFSDKIVIDVGAGTGRLSMLAAEKGSVVFAVEPVHNLREYLKHKAQKMGLTEIFPVDGLITDIPFPDDFADITMGGHVFGDQPRLEFLELVRVTIPGGMIILCPGNNDMDNEIHQFLVEQGCEWSRFEEPEDGMKRKYWKVVS